ADAPRRAEEHFSPPSSGASLTVSDTSTHGATRMAHKNKGSRSRKTSTDSSPPPIASSAGRVPRSAVPASVHAPPRVAPGPVTAAAERGTAIQQPTEFKVHGVISDFTGRALPDVVVRAYDQDLRKRQQLGDAATTDAHGIYSILYSREQFSRAEKGTADLAVCVFSPDAEGLGDRPLV